MILEDTELDRKIATVVSRPKLEEKLGIHPTQVTADTQVAGHDELPLFTTPEEQQVARMAWEQIRKLSHQPQTLPSVTHLQKPEIRDAIVQAVTQRRPVPCRCKLPWRAFRKRSISPMSSPKPVN